MEEYIGDLRHFTNELVLSYIVKCSREGAMISFSKVYGTEHSTKNAIRESIDAKPNALTKAQEDAGISKKATIDMKEFGKGNKIDTTA